MPLSRRVVIVVVVQQQQQNVRERERFLRVRVRVGAAEVGSRACPARLVRATWLKLASTLRRAAHKLAPARASRAPFPFGRPKSGEAGLLISPADDKSSPSLPHTTRRAAGASYRLLHPVATPRAPRAPPWPSSPRCTGRRSTPSASSAVPCSPLSLQGSSGVSILLLLILRRRDGRARRGVWEAAATQWELTSLLPAVDTGSIGAITEMDSFVEDFGKLTPTVRGVTVAVRSSPSSSSLPPPPAALLPSIPPCSSTISSLLRFPSLRLPPRIVHERASVADAALLCRSSSCPRPSRA